MVLGATYVRGRTNGSTTESASLTRVAGQFTTPFLSCPVRAASSQRVQITIGTKVTATVGAVILFFDPDNAYNGAGQDASGVLFSWYTDANNLIEVIYNKASTRFELTRKASGTGTTLNLTSTFTAGAATALLIAWSATTIYAAVNGGAISSSADANIPTLPTTCDIGSRAGATSFDAAFGAVAFLSAVASLAQWQAIAALASSRPPCFGEAVGSLMTGLWYGAHSRVWSVETGATIIDLNDATNGLVLERIGGAGIAPVDHRVVQTPLRDGSAYVDSRLLPRTLVAQMLLSGASMATWYALRRTVIAAINPRRGAQGIVCFAPSTSVYEIDAIVSGGLGFEGSGPFVEDVAIAFLCPDPTWRIAALTESQQTVPSAGLTIPLTIPLELSEAAITFSVTNSGDMDSYPTFVVTAGSAGCEGIQLENVTTGKLFKLDGLSLTVGQYVTVNMEDRTAVLSTGTNVFGYLTAASQMWPLTVGTNSVKVSVDTGAATLVESHSNRLVGV